MLRCPLIQQTLGSLLCSRPRAEYPGVCSDQGGVLTIRLAEKVMDTQLVSTTWEPSTDGAPHAGWSRTRHVHRVRLSEEHVLTKHLWRGNGYQHP